jgi:hypothetical protein
VQHNGISCWWVSFASPQFSHCSSPIIVGLQYLILPILDKPNMGLFWVVVQCVWFSCSSCILLKIVKHASFVMFPTYVKVSLLGKVLEFKLLDTFGVHIRMQAYINGCSRTWYRNITSTHKGCWWDCLSYFVLRYVEQFCARIYYSNFFLFPSCHSCSCWKPRFEHVSFLFPVIWNITFNFFVMS